MPCYHPLQAFRQKEGIKFVTYRASPDSLRLAGGKDYLQIPCGKCPGCRLERSRQWSMRIMHEASLSKACCFITLTYDNEHLPRDGGLYYKDFQSFMKRLRKHFQNQNRNIRFYMCGEYGEKNFRPHYHATMFNLEFSDLEFHSKNGRGESLFTSKILTRLWGKGICTIGQLTAESAAYVARYVMKKIGGEPAKEHYKRPHPVTGEIFQVTPEFARMSNRGGIGLSWYESWKDDVYPHDMVIFKNFPCKPPRYYDKKLEQTDPVMHSVLKEARRQKSDAKGRRNGFDDSPERLATKEICKLKKLEKLKRQL